MLLLIDNFDSFTYNLVDYFEVIGKKVKVIRNDNQDYQQIIQNNKIDSICISPGPSNPDNAGISLNVINEYKEKLPILGVCLGHQAIIQAFGGKIIKASEPVHGKVFEVLHNGKNIFEAIPSPFKATRYHSLIGEYENFPEELEIIATLEDKKTIMGVAHKKLPIFGVQFHPESIASEYGHEILKNFLENI